MKHHDFRVAAVFIFTTVATALIAGCAGGAARTGGTSFIPVQESGSPEEAVIERLAVDSDAITGGGIYASEVYGSDIFGYPANNGHNGKPICTVANVSSANGIAVDGVGDLIDPDGGSHTIIIFKGPKMCGPKIASVNDPYGQPSDAASNNAASQTIVVANIFDNNRKPGSISRCTVAHGCTANLKSASMNEVAGVALAKDGDCWASATNKKGTATLTYFKGCAEPAAVASGYRNAYYGGLDIDVHGNLVSLSYFDKKVYVYKDCKPACKLVGGPFALKGQATFGHLNANSTRFVTGDYEYGQIDVYAYAPTKVKFVYSFNAGLNASEIVEGAAYNPRSAE
jgi:hypothetical protein